MMENLPIDTSHPAVREYLALVRSVPVFEKTAYTELTWSCDRLQVLTPLSLLINIATLMVCTFMLDPNLGKV